MSRGRNRAGVVLAAAAVASAVVFAHAPAAGARLQQAESGKRPASDATIRARVERVLQSASDIPGRDIVVEVREGVVTLTGEVATTFVQQSVGAVVRAVPGVNGVRFSLRIRPPDPSPPGRGSSPVGRGAPRPPDTGSSRAGMSPPA